MRALLAAVFLVGCSVEGNLPDVEIVQHDVVIPAVPLEARVGEPSIALPTFMEPHDHLALDRTSYSSVKVRAVEIKAKSGVSDLSFIRDLRLSMNGVQGYFAGTGAVEIGHYSRDTAPQTGATLILESNPPAEVVVPWRDPLSVVLIEVKGTLPDEKWTVDVTVRLSATLTN